MGVVYFRRFRMEIPLDEETTQVPPLPADYRFVPWEERLLATHAETKYRCFKDELDAHVFPSLGDREGCRRLMAEIAGRTGFVPEATWLIEYWPPAARRPEPCGTIQGVLDDGLGAIQNIGITPAHRGRGLGTVLIRQALAGFRKVGVQRVYLEVTAQNHGACRLYERLGFRKTRVVYKASQVAYAEW